MHFTRKLTLLGIAQKFIVWVCIFIGTLYVHRNIEHSICKLSCMYMYYIMNLYKMVRRIYATNISTYVNVCDCTTAHNEKEQNLYKG